MMTNAVFGVSNYYKLFASPLNSYEVNPVSNLIYGATAGRIYSQTVAKKVKDSMSSYLSSLNSNIVSLKEEAKPLASKEVDYGKVKLTSNRSDGKDIKTSVEMDINAIKKDIKAFVDSYNKAFDFANSKFLDFNSFYSYLTSVNRTSNVSGRYSGLFVDVLL